MRKSFIIILPIFYEYIDARSGRPSPSKIKSNEDIPIKLMEY